MVATSPISLSVAEIAGRLPACSRNSISPTVSLLVDRGRLAAVAGPYQCGRGRRYCVAGDPRTHTGPTKRPRRHAAQELLQVRVPAATLRGGPAPEAPLSALDRAIVNAVTILRPVTAAVLRHMLEDEYPTEGIALRLARLVELGHLMVESTRNDGHRYAPAA